MTISFNAIPSGLRVPLFYAEMDASMANSATVARRAILIGQKLAAGSAVAGTPYIVSSSDQAKALFGVGSMLARMHAAYRQGDAFGEVWAIPLADNAAGVAATGTITVTGPATAAGTVNLYIAGQRVQVAVASGDTATAVATAIVAAIGAATDLPVTAANTAGVVTWTCRWKGSTGSDIQVSDSYRGSGGGETLPAGIALAYAAGTAGATDPLMTAAVAAMGDEPYDYIIHPYADTTSLDAWQTELGDATGRWSWSRQVYGHGYTAKRGTLSALVTAGGLRNDPHHTIAAIDADCQNPVWEFAAAYGAANAVCLNADVARPTQTTPLVAILPPRQGKRFLLTDRQSLLGYGIATSVVNGGYLRVERAITTYQKNTWGQADNSYLDSETLHTSAYVLRKLASVITTKYARHKLANDGTRFGAGQAIVTPKVIRAELLAMYSSLENEGIVENAEAFGAALIVERNASNPNRVDVLFPPDYVNQLRIFAVLNQFRLNYA
jgi:phage tail sheath gpL-like